MVAIPELVLLATAALLLVLIAGVGITSALLLFVFLRYTRLGWAVRETAQDRDAAMQMGVDVNRVNQTVFGIAAALGGVSGMLVGMYYNQIDTAMSLQATLKGVVAEVVGIRKETLHLKFSPESIDEVKYYLELKVGAEAFKPAER